MATSHCTIQQMMIHDPDPDDKSKNERPLFIICPSLSVHYQSDYIEYSDASLPRACCSDDGWRNHLLFGGSAQPHVGQEQVPPLASVLAHFTVSYVETTIISHQVTHRTRVQ